jgi:hypothetical protein
MSRTTYRLAISAAATVGLIWPVLVPNASAAADPSPGVPCLDMVQEFAASPLTIPESLDAAAAALGAGPAAAAPAAAAVPGPAVPLAGAPIPAVVPPVPVVPLGDAVPGLPLLPGSLPVPHDFVCEGTAWSATKKPGTGAGTHAAALADRREW